MEKTCFFKYRHFQSFWISNTLPLFQSANFESPKLPTYHSIYTYIITIMSFLTSIRGSSRQAIRTNFVMPASTFHSSAVRSLKEDDKSQYTTTNLSYPY